MCVFFCSKKNFFFDVVSVKQKQIMLTLSICIYWIYKYNDNEQKKEMSSSSFKLINFDSLCGAKHWNQTLSWYTDHNPDFTYCFEETCLLWTPCLILFIFTCFQMINLRKKSTKKFPSIHQPLINPIIPWNIFNVANLVGIFVLFCFLFWKSNFYGRIHY